MKKSLIIIFCFLSSQMVAASPLSTFLLPLRFLHQQIINQNILAFHTDTSIVPLMGKKNPLTLEGGVYKLRLDSLVKQVPLDYNEYVQGYINIYLRNREEMAHVLGLTKYYFPIYEKAFKDAGIPDEIKYLSIVESKLDPFAVSRVGATGPWQFMFETAKLYGLNMDSYVDERRDPVQASYAAAAYLKDAYEEFGDWLLAIASYNCGKSNVERAMAKAGASDFWSIRPYLPLETRGYVPAFIAINYVMNYYNKHNITPAACGFSLKTDTVFVNKFVSLKTISRAIDVDIKELVILNPAYKKQILNGTDATPRRLVLTQINNEKYSALYDALDGSDIVTSFKQTIYATTHSKHHRSFLTYKVKRGDTLGGIAAKFNGASIEKIRAINGIKRDRLHPGMTIKI